MDLLHRLEAARLMVAEVEDTLFASVYNAQYVIKTICDAKSHIRSCQWLDES